MLFRAVSMLGLVVAMCGCGGSEPPSETSTGELSSRTGVAEREDEPGSTRASREVAGEGSAIETATDHSAASGPGALAVERPLLTITRSDASRGEDGRGASVPATDPIAFDVDARRFPPRAIDPVLFVGALRFTRYEHPSPGVLRFVAADRARLERGAEIAVQYGDDASTRVIVSPSLALPEAP